MRLPFKFHSSWSDDSAQAFGNRKDDNDEKDNRKSIGSRIDEYDRFWLRQYSYGAG